MEDTNEESVQEKLTHGTLSARRVLLATSLIGFLVAITPLSADEVSIFGITLSTNTEVLRGSVTLVLICLTIGFVVRVFTDLVGTKPTLVEVSLHERIYRQTETVQRQTANRLASLFPSKTNRVFQSDSFESLLRDEAAKNPEYRAAMIKNTMQEIHEFVSPYPLDRIANEDSLRSLGIHDLDKILSDLLFTHEQACKRLRLKNAPRWAVHKTLIFLRFKFFDALAPSIIPIFVIALLVGWIDSSWLIQALSKLGEL